jgi:hypothetical protein
VQIKSALLFLALSLTTGLWVSDAVANNKSATTSAISMDDLATEGKRYSGFVSADFYGGFRINSDPSAAYYLNASYKLNRGSVQLYQVWSHRLIKNQGESEIMNSDTHLRFLSTSGDFLDNWKWQYRAEVTLPTSQFSDDQDVHSKPSVQLRFNSGVLDDKLAFSIRPFYREHLNRYTTTVTGEGAGGGRPLVKSAFGVGFIASWIATDRMSFDFSAVYTRIRYEKVQFENNQPSLGYSNFAQHQYLYDVGVNYDLIPAFWSVSAGYSLDSVVERLGGIEYLAFDDKISVWYLRTTLLF